ncbi:MAG: hypothetical protein ABSF29_09895 [Tepidisphaeraceae bacterium]|jgi:hypothetical protein
MNSPVDQTSNDDQNDDATNQTTNSVDSIQNAVDLATAVNEMATNSSSKYAATGQVADTVLKGAGSTAMVATAAYNAYNSPDPLVSVATSAVNDAGSFVVATTVTEASVPVVGPVAPVVGVVTAIAMPAVTDIATAINNDATSVVNQQVQQAYNNDVAQNGPTPPGGWAGTYSVDGLQYDDMTDLTNSQ